MVRSVGRRLLRARHLGRYLRYLGISRYVRAGHGRGTSQDGTNLDAMAKMWTVPLRFIIGGSTTFRRFGMKMISRISYRPADHVDLLDHIPFEKAFLTG